jgi:Protein of unknown function (DUF3592)
MRNLIWVLLLAGVAASLYHFDVRPDDLAGPIFRWVFVAIGVLLGAGLIAAVAIGYRQSNQMGSWPATEGTITRSEARFVTTRFGNDNPTTHREADIAYEFTVTGTVHLGTRVVQAGAPTEAEVERLLRDYPIGTKVTVHYDPKTPDDSIIERPDPVSPFRYLLLPALLAAGYAVWLYGNPVPDAFLPLLLIAGVFGLFFSWAFWAWFRQYRQVARFVETDGTVTISRTESFIRYHHGDRKGLVRIEDETRGEKLFRAVVEYTYQAEGQSYSNRKIRSSGEVTGPEEHVKKLIAGYKPGSAVKVWYEPGNPARSTLMRTTKAGWILLPLAVGCFALALAAL